MIEETESPIWRRVQPQARTTTSTEIKLSLDDKPTQLTGLHTCSCVEKRTNKYLIMKNASLHYNNNQERCNLDIKH